MDAKLEGKDFFEWKHRKAVSTALEFPSPAALKTEVPSIFIQALFHF
jgi:hypothetical protein